MPNSYQYQGDYSEFDDDLGWNDFALRSYDPQLGRFLQHDPYDQFASGYVGMGNDPGNEVDPTGGWVDPLAKVISGASGGVLVVPTQAQLAASALRKAASQAAKTQKLIKTTIAVANVVKEFIPFVSSATDIYEGARDGDLVQLGLGAVGLVTDFFGGSIIKGAIKIGAKALIKSGAKKVIKNVAEEGGESLAKKAARKVPCGCFIAGTLILTNAGAKPIEQIKLGDIVWAYNDTTQSYGQKKVIHLFQYQRDSVYHITVGKETIKATADHPFYIGGRWLRVAELKIGDSVKLFDGSNLVIEQITVVPGRTTVYNFEVEDYHTYYVGDAKVLVHNEGPCGNVLPGKPGSNATSGNNKYAQEGKQKHKELDNRVEQKEGWEHDWAETGFEGTDGNIYYPDVKTPSGNYLEYKPDTNKGCSRGKSQIKKYKSVHPDSNVKFRVIYYKPGG